MARRDKNAPGEKAKNFKTAIQRLLKELGKFKILIVLALILAFLSSVLSICTPNILSDLTDTIRNGLNVNTTNIEKLSSEIKNSITTDKINLLIDVKISHNELKKLLKSDINKEDKIIIETMLNSINVEDIMKSITRLSLDTFSRIVGDSTIEGIKITKEDKYSFFTSINTGKINVPESISKVIFENITIDNIKITKEEQRIFINEMSAISLNDVNSIYAKIDIMPKSIRNLINPVMDIEEIKNITLLLVFLYLLSALFNYTQSIAMTDVSNKFAKRLRTSISGKINRLPLKYFDKTSIGDVLSRVTNDVDTIAHSMGNSLATLVSAVALFIGTTIMMFVTNSVLAITAIVSSLIGFLFMGKILSKSQKYFIEKQNGLGNLNGHIEEVYSGFNVVKAYNGKEECDIKFDELNNKLYKANMMSQFLSGLMHPLMHFMGNLGYVAVCIVGALLTMNGNISFGVIVAFILYVRLFSSPLTQIAQSMTNLQTTVAASERVFEFLDEEELLNEDDKKEHLAKSKVKGKIEFENVTFKYDGNDKPTIKSFSAKINPGEKIAIVGPTGAGKTTIVNLLMKFYEISGGDIKIDDVSINDLTRKNIHDLFIMVLQDTWIFDGTIKENIKYNSEDVSDDMIKDVCKTVGLDHFIKTLPSGYDSHITSNDSISAGQRQLLTIARGMIKDAPFLILDEATSNVDTRTEELVQNAMDKLTEGKTSFIIAHRLSTIKNADLILVMNEGNIIEQGNHNELMKRNGFYANLYNSQFKL